MLIRIDPTRDEPVFAQIAGSVRTSIVSGDLPQGGRLPAAKEVAESLEVNVHTVLHAYQVLRDEGLIELRRGKGATVAADTADMTTLSGEIERLLQAAGRAGIGRDALARLVRDAPT